MKKGLFLPFLSLIFLVVFIGTAFSDTPQLISFQGRIVDANGQPLADGNYSMTFKIFNVSVGGAALWTETQGTVSVANGLFSVLLGSVTSLSSLGFNENYWLEITVGASTYTPRQQIASSAYALNIPDLRVTTAKISPGTAGQLLMSNATPATTWTTMSGDVTINSSGATTIQADSVALGTDTTGNYAGSNAEGGSATNAFACSADGTCEIQTGIQSTSNNSITVDALNTGANSTITLTNSNGTYVANVNIADGALQVGGTSVIDSSRNVSNVVNLTNTGNTSLGDAGTDTLTVYPNTMNLTGNVGKTIDVGTGALDTTLTVTNSGAGTANLSVEGSVTATSFSGSASNALACSGDATCEANAITVTNDISVSSGSITVSTGNVSVTSGNVTIGGTINTGIAATEVYQMNQAVRTTDAVTFAGITNSGNTTLGDAGADTLTLYSTTMDWNNVDEDKTIQVGSGLTDRTLNITNPDVTGKANLTVEGTVTAFAFTGSSTNALACSGDATCETNAISATGNVYPSVNNTYTLGTSANRWSTVYGVGGDLSGNLTVSGTITGTLSGTASNANACSADATCEAQAVSATGNLTVTGGTTTLNNGTSNLINFGTAGVAVPSAASAGWKIKTYGNNYGLGIEGSTQWFSTGQYYKFYNSDGSTYWKGRLLIDTANTITYPAVYAYDNAVTPAATLIEFKTGIYNNGNTFYSQNQIYARGGIANDTASTTLALNDADGVTLSGPLYYGSDPFVKWIAYSEIADANGTPCPTSYKVVSCFTDAAATLCGAGTGADGEGGYFCGGYSFPSPDNCPLNGRLLCVYAP